MRTLALVPAPLPSLRLLRAEGRVRALLADVLGLEAEREALEAELSRFSSVWEREAGAALADLDDAERLVRRLRRLEDDLVQARTVALEPPGSSTAAPRAASRRPAPAAARAHPRPQGRPAAQPGDAIVVEPEEVALKRLHRRLARAVHPDLARGDGERAAFADWMARVNSAYHRRDLAGLEILAEKIGIGAAPGETTEAERLSRLERRALALAAARDSLARDLARLRSSEAFRVRAEMARRAESGGDLAAETRAAATSRIAALRGEALSRYDGAAECAADFEHALHLADPPPRGKAGVGGAVLSRCSPARRAVALADLPRAGRALELARELEDAALGAEPWEAALTLLAFFAEVGGRAPAALASAGPLRERWDALRGGWPRAPDLPHALARLPRHLDVGVRFRGSAVECGLQLSTADGLAGVRGALASGALRALAREVLAVCGPRERCDACDASVFAVHLLRTRGLDDVHGMACPRCGTVLRSYWRYGDAEGLEALSPLALEVGLVAEAHVRFGRRTVAFQMLPGRRADLTGGGLARLVYALYVQPHGLPLQPGHLAFQPDGSSAPLDPEARVAPGPPVKLRLTGAAMREREVVSWVKGRIEERFRR